MTPPVPRRERLAVYLGDSPIGLLADRTLGYVAFDFERRVVEQIGEGSRILSVGIPTSAETVDPLIATPFFAGLLPEGDVLKRIATEFRLDPLDTFGLLDAIGRECAGALIFTREGENPPGPGDVRWLDEAELAAEIRGLGEFPLGVRSSDDSIRLSLAGAQDKLPVVVEAGRVGLPLHGHPSTHIVKPASVRTTRSGELRFPDLVANEAFCLTIAAELAIPAAEVSVRNVAGERALFVERYDRAHRGGAIVRIHQEDMCQALAISPHHKYESSGGPSVRRIADLLDEVSVQPLVDRRSLFRLLVLNVLIGNADAHGKNLSLLHGDDGIRLAPAYDLVATQLYSHPEALGMWVGEARDLSAVNRNTLLQAGTDCGFGADAAEQLVDELLDDVPGAVEAATARARAENWWVDRLTGVISGIEQRSQQIRE